jgi:hypothetical protein
MDISRMLASYQQIANKLPTSSALSQPNSKKALFVGEMLAMCQQIANISLTFDMSGLQGF